jgi:hypothetical protein
MDRIEVTKALASQKIYFRAPEGRPSATPSVGTADRGGSALTAAATTYVAIDPVNTTLSAGASAGASTLTLTSVTGIRKGATYRIQNTTDPYEDVRVIGINSSTKVVTLDEPIEHTYIATDTFLSTEFYYTLQTADVASLAELNIATATYTVTGYTPAPIVIAFDVVLHPLINPLTRDRIASRWPDLCAQEWDEQRGEDFERQRTDAWDRVKNGLRQKGFRPACVVTPEDLFEWGMAELALILQEGGIEVVRGLDNYQALEYLLQKRNSEKAAALSAISFYDEDEDAALGEGESKPLRMSMIR